MTPAYAGTHVFWRTEGPRDRPHGGTLGLLFDPDAPDFAAGGARCLDADPELFHPVGYTKAAEDEAQETIVRYCRPCPMMVACLAYGLRNGGETGIWGGVWLDQPTRPGRRRR